MILNNVQPTRSACSSDFTPVFGTFRVFCQLPISFSFLNIPVDLGSEKMMILSQMPAVGEVMKSKLSGELIAGIL